MSTLRTATGDHADRGNGTTALTSRRRNDFTIAYPELAVAGVQRSINVRAMLDGEVVALDQHGRRNSSCCRTVPAWPSRWATSRLRRPAAGERSPLNVPYDERRGALEEVRPQQSG